MQGSIEILEWGEGRMTGSFNFFFFLSWILVFELEKNTYKYIYKQMTYL